MNPFKDYDNIDQSVVDGFPVSQTKGTCMKCLTLSTAMLQGQRTHQGLHPPPISNSDVDS